MGLIAHALLVGSRTSPACSWRRSTPRRECGAIVGAQSCAARCGVSSVATLALAVAIASSPMDPRGEALVTPAFSVLIAAFNAETTIADTLESLVAQTRGDWEAIVVDDGSTDGTAAVMSRYAFRDPRITVEHKENGGTASARNLAARRASATMWCILDADDLYLPEYLERMGSFISDHPGYDIYSSNGYFFREGTAPWPDEFTGNQAVRSCSVEDMLRRDCFSVHSVFRSSVFEIVGGFDEDPRTSSEDYCFWLTAMLRGARQIHNPERLWMYRLSERQKTSDRLRLMRADMHLLKTLLERNEITGPRVRIARSVLRRSARECRHLEALPVRRDLELRLTRGDMHGARAAYISAWRAYSSRAKYLLGLLVVLVSPQTLARLLPRIAAEILNVCEEPEPGPSAPSNPAS